MPSARLLSAFCLCLTLTTPMLNAQQPPNPYTTLMQKAAAHARAHHALPPVLSPNDATVLSGDVPMALLQAQGVQVIPWTTNDPEKIRAILKLAPNGLISDRPDILQRVLAEERQANPETLQHFDVQGHRGGRGLRPENTLPAFEAGMDNGITTIETDTGVTTDHQSLIWHDQFLNPASCRHADGSPYTLENRTYIRDISLPEAQSRFICDKLRPNFPDQKNDLSLSPVAVAFAEKEHLQSPYVPTHAAQLFRFAAFYADFYSKGPGKNHPQAAARAHTGQTVHFNLETKILPPNLPAIPGVPPEELVNHTVSPQIFVDTLCGAIQAAHMESRADVQSFDFRTLILVEEQHPDIRTVYLTESPASLSSTLIPIPLRQ